ncbi:MAG: NTP transferase domain-containing protein [Candidatus Marinimicrobia bacterium]|nr:NTP transferase domain-containing protein [Candidatus Neomarinimicrobiota bacterium]
MMKCIILAAGKGSRMNMRGVPKPLIPFLGMPLIERVILTFKNFGIGEFIVVLGYKADVVREFLSGLIEKYNIKIEFTYNNEWDRENGLSLLAGKDFVNEPFILTMTDHLFDEKIIDRFLRYVKDKKSEGILLAVDKKKENIDHIDLKDVTKVYTVDSKIIRIGKDLDQYNAFDTGLFYCTPEVFDAAEKAIKKGKTTLSDVVLEMAARDKAFVFDILEEIWFDIDTEPMFKRAEKYFLKKYNKSDRKVNLDGPVSRLINRKISLLISKYLSYKNVTPMQISIFSFLLSIVSGIIFMIKGYIPLLIAGIIAQLSSIIDGCDGEIARIKNMVSDTGGWIDSVLDRYADSFILIGLTVHSSFYVRHIVALLTGFFAVIGGFINSYTADKYDGYLKKKLKKHKKLTLRLGRDVRIFIIFLGSLFNIPFITLLLLALITNFENVRRLVSIYRIEDNKVLSTKS